MASEIMSDEQRFTNPGFRVAPKPSTPPAHARSGANLNSVIIRAMQKQHEAVAFVYEQADKLLDFLKSTPPPKPEDNKR